MRKVTGAVAMAVFITAMGPLGLAAQETEDAQGGNAGAAAAPAAELSADMVLATVNGKPITLGHVIAFREKLPEQYQTLPDEVLLDGILNQLIQQQALADVARAEEDRRMRIGLENQLRAFYASELLARLQAEPVTEEELRALYEERFANAAPEPEWNASHILVETEEEARRIAEEARKEGADFAALAREHSKGPSGRNGGELGWFGPGMMVEPFEQAVAALEPGQVSDPVRTEFGWHVIRLNDKREKAPPSFEEVRDQLEQELRQKRVEERIQQLTEAASVEKADISLPPAVIRQDELLD